MTLNLKIPVSWGELTQKQLRYVYEILSSDRFSMHQCKVILALRLAGVRIETRDNDGKAWLRKGKILFQASDSELLAIAHTLDWIEKYPILPVRLEMINGRMARHPLMNGMKFGEWIIVDNLYQTYISTKDVSRCKAMFTHLYPDKAPVLRRFRSFRLHARDASTISPEAMSIFRWVAAFKEWLPLRYPNFYQRRDKNAVTPSPKDIRDAMNAQIRALTKGDITKERAVLDMEIHRALTELDALALEAEKLRIQLKKQS